MQDGKKESEGSMSKPILYLWLAGVALVGYTFLWHGCVHFTCASGANGEVAFRSRRSTGATKFMGMYDTVAECEMACADAGEGKNSCKSFTYFVHGELSKQCFAGLEGGWSLQADSAAVSGRPFFLTKSTLAAAAHPFAGQLKTKFKELLVSIEQWPIVAKAKEAVDAMPPRPVVSEKAWLLLSALLFFWPALLQILIGASPPAEVRAETVKKVEAAKAAKRAAAAAQPETPATDKDGEKIPIISDVQEMATTVGKNFEEGIKGFAEGLQNLMPKKEEEAAAAPPAAVSAN